MSDEPDGYEIDWNRLVERIIAGIISLASMYWGYTGRQAAQQYEGALDARRGVMYTNQSAAYYEGSHAETETIQKELKEEADGPDPF